MSVSEKTIYILALANVFLLAFVLHAVRRTLFGLRKELKRSADLRREAERYREMFEETAVGVFQTDTAGRLQYLNQAGLKILGFDRAREVTGGNISVFQFYVNVREDENIRNSLKMGIPVQNRLVEIINARGERLSIEGTTREIRDDAGILTGYDGFFRDMTYRVTAMEALRDYSDNLERLAMEKTAEILALEREKMNLEKRAAAGEMASAMVHELRNPLSSMKMAFLTIKNRHVSDERMSRVMEEATVIGQNMANILEDALDFARPRELRLILQDLRPILNEAADSAQAGCKNPGIAIRREVPSGPVTAVVDSARMSQAVRNLLQNSVDAVGEGRGEIILKAEFFPEQEVLRITVSDDGPGIAPEDLDRAFEPFFTHKDGGAGLGLTLVRKIAEAHHGRASVVGRPGGGTEARIELPAESP
jgi:PAS domain S-box-containing protein